MWLIVSLLVATSRSPCFMVLLIFSRRVSSFSSWVSWQRVWEGLRSGYSRYWRWNRSCSKHWILFSSNDTGCIDLKGYVIVRCVAKSVLVLLLHLRLRHGCSRDRMLRHYWQVEQIFLMLQSIRTWMCRHYSYDVGKVAMSNQWVPSAIWFLSGIMDKEMGVYSCWMVEVWWLEVKRNVIFEVK